MEPSKFMASSLVMHTLKHAVHITSINLCNTNDKLAYMDTFGKRITAAREAAELSVIAFAEKMKVTRQAVYAWERDENEMTAVNLVIAADVLKVRHRWLVTGQGQRSLSEMEIIDIEVRPILSLVKSLPSNVREHFILLMQDFASNVGLTVVSGKREGKKTYIEETVEYEQSSSLSRPKKRSGQTKTG